MSNTTINETTMIEPTMQPFFARGEREREKIENKTSERIDISKQTNQVRVSRFEVGCQGYQQCM